MNQPKPFLSRHPILDALAALAGYAAVIGLFALACVANPFLGLLALPFFFFALVGEPD